MPILDLDKFVATPLARQPFDHIVVPQFIAASALGQIIADFPHLSDPGLHPLSEASFGPAFARFVADIQSPALTAAFSAKFGIDLAPHPVMVTVRARCQAKDGRIHNDSESKIVSALIYLNDRWDQDGGRFRILNGPDDIDDFAAEVPPEGGTLAAFRRSENSFHGHRPFEGARRYVMFNWMVDRAALDHELARHRLSSHVKRIGRKLRAAVGDRARA